MQSWLVGVGVLAWYAKGVKNNMRFLISRTWNRNNLCVATGLAIRIFLLPEFAPDSYVLKK
jgi:hypothetical protein